ncbi:superoxide dismutase [Methanolobus sediminis]|uniref:Superoxide dismutase n=1 Tax=Methanolobus sediminis TaxID=3072978 RepID=A0AA51UMM3_9EURY|nr:superoxide dismutase [Methanolobus sediminis]WMW26379.1 superoxide dismutase [Methanolobus sediminis]
MTKELYKLPELKYGYADLEPYISEEQLRIHYEKHHQSYVNNVNSLLQMMDKAVEDGTEFDSKTAARSLSFNLGGHVLHSYFWWEMTPAEKASEEPVGELYDAIKESFGSFERFKSEFTKVASSVEGSGWAALTFCNDTKRLGIMQIEKHNTNLIPDFPIIMDIDVWEHAYYLDYKNARNEFIDAFWNIVDWEAINQWFVKIKNFSME